MSHYTANDMVVCLSPDGWSLHAPDATDAEIAAGDAPPLLFGVGEPDEAAYDTAFKIWQERVWLRGYFT